MAARTRTGQCKRVHDTLTRRGLRLEYATLGWNVIGVPILVIAAIRSSTRRQDRERIGLRLIGCAFLLLALYVTAQAAYSFLGGHHPGHTTLGIVWTAATCIVMRVLARGKAITGRALGNPVLQAESGVTLVDACLAAAVLVGLTLNAALGWWWADPLAGLVIVGYAIREARITLGSNGLAP